MGKDLVSGSVANAAPAVPVEEKVDATAKTEGMKPALGSKEEEEAKKARIEKEKQNREMERLVVKFNNEILKEDSWVASNDTELD
jgi:hypothetical protein